MKNKKILASSGFTLVEIMISLVLSSFVIAGVYGVYSIQQRSYKTQEQVADLQQQLRSALDFMTRDIRMVSYNPGGVCSGMNVARNGILSDISASNNFSFEYCDLDDSGNWKLHTVTYAMNNGKLERNLTIADSSTTGGQTRTIAEGIDAIDFRHLKDDAQTAVTDVRETRVIRLSILIRSLYPDPHHKDTTLYIPPSPAPAWTSLISSTINPPNDNYHRRLLVTSIELRNVGL